MKRYGARLAWLPRGWASDVTIAVDDAGDIAAIEVGARHDDVEMLNGIALPGVPNLHSHAFQRAMAGLTERAGPGGDDFWTWREAAYRFLARLTPEDVEAIAARLYVELVMHGFTSVAEFHYVHNDRDGMAYEDPTTMCEAVLAAAGAAGIGMTLLPVLYQTGGFGGRAASDGQRRFLMNTDGFLALYETLLHRHRRDGQVRIGIAPHSLRAVTPDTLLRVVGAVRERDADAPIHLHIAEQTKEVEDCLAWSGARPVAWLLDHAPVDRRWCAVHATHMTAEETRALAASGAVAGLCPTTEANLGDGFFALQDFITAGGRYGVGSDSNVSTSPVEELRWLEYGQRLLKRRRNLAPSRPGESSGAALLRAALAGGAAACGRRIGALAPGARADIVLLDPEHPALVGRRGDDLIDAWIFSGNDTPIRDVMIGGAFVVRDRTHIHEEQSREDFARAMTRLQG